MKSMKLGRAAMAASLLLGLAITAAPSYAGTVNKKPVPKISSQAIKVSGAKTTMNQKSTVTAPLAKKAKSGK